MNEQPSSEPVLKACPFCSGVARWCMDAEHECHLIVCTGCGIQVDMLDNPDTETVYELRVIMAQKWNLRV